MPLIALNTLYNVYTIERVALFSMSGAPVLAYAQDVLAQHFIYAERNCGTAIWQISIDGSHCFSDRNLGSSTEYVKWMKVSGSKYER